MSPRLVIAAVWSAIIVGAVALPAEAKIVCNKGFQMVAGSWLSTPYCRDNYIAEVARTYGFSASAERVRNNPLYKQRLCRFVGQDIRIKESCDEVSPSGRKWF